MGTIWQSRAASHRWCSDIDTHCTQFRSEGPRAEGWADGHWLGSTLPAEGSVWKPSAFGNGHSPPLLISSLWLMFFSCLQVLFPKESETKPLSPFCRCEPHARSRSGQWAWSAGDATNVRWWKTAKSLVGTPAGEQTGPLPSTWQVRSVDGDTASVWLFLRTDIPICPWALDEGSWKRPPWLKLWVTSYSADELFKPSKQALWLIQVEVYFGGWLEHVHSVPCCRLSVQQPSFCPTNVCVPGVGLGTGE